MIMQVVYVRTWRDSAYVSVLGYLPDGSPRVHENVLCVGFCPVVGDVIRVVWSAKKRRRYGLKVGA